MGSNGIGDCWAGQREDLVVPTWQAIIHKSPASPAELIPAFQWTILRLGSLENGPGRAVSPRCPTVSPSGALDFPKRHGFNLLFQKLHKNCSGPFVYPTIC